MRRRGERKSGGKEEIQRTHKGGVNGGREGTRVLVHANKEITVPTVAVIARFS